jgi:hypothetical protein
MGLMGVCLTAGCSLPTSVVHPSGYFYLDKTADFSSVGKIAVLELGNDNVSGPELGKILTQTLADNLGKKHLFSIRTIYQTDVEWKGLNLDKAQTFSTRDMVEIRKQLNVDAILVGTVTRYHSYPQLLTALRLKLLDLRDGRLLWAIEDVWDSTDKNIEIRVKRFFDSQMRTGYQPMNWQFVINSPMAFHKFVMYEVVSTLPDSRMK